MKEYSVWVRVQRVKAENLNEAMKKVDRGLKSLNVKAVVLKELTRDFYPKEKK